jgi:transposase InsO family protein
MDQEDPMVSRPPLTLAEKKRIYRDKLRGRSLTEIAAELDCSPATVRKWWRQARDYGLARLHQGRRSRAATGILSRFAPIVTAQALAYKRAHPRWGPDRVLVELQHDPLLLDQRLPSRSRLALLFKAECPQLLTTPQPARPLPPPPRPTAVHECWQLDSQEAIRLTNGQIATICTIRDPVGAVILASQAFEVTTARHWRKLTWEEVRSVIRSACAIWGTLPDALQTDNELCLNGSPTDPFPSRLTLWLIGLGVLHRRIRPGRPTDQAQIERSHRTLANFVGTPEGLPDLPSLQQRLDLEREQHNAWFPSRASDCAGRPPLVAHPEVRHARRPFRVEWERRLFDEQRVYSHLASVTLQRKVSTNGRISLGRRLFQVGRRWAGQMVDVRCDPLTREWVAQVAENELVRHPIVGVDAATLTGIADIPSSEEQPIQLTLPCFAA